MTLLQWAVVCSIRQQPDYRFLGSEKRYALRMVADGLLYARGDGHPDQYTVTTKGLRLFKEGVAAPYNGGMWMLTEEGRAAMKVSP